MRHYPRLGERPNTGKSLPLRQQRAAYNAKPYTFLVTQRKLYCEHHSTEVFVLKPCSRLLTTQNIHYYV